MSLFKKYVIFILLKEVRFFGLLALDTGIAPYYKKEGHSLKKRVISAVVLLIVTTACVFLSEASRVIFFAVAGICCAYELSHNLEKLQVYCCAWVMYVYIAMQAVLALLHAGSTLYIACLIAGVYLALFSGIVHKKVSGSGALYTLAGLAYPGFLFGIMMMISVSDIWLPSLVIGALSAWICDSFALFGGMAFGKHKVAPNVSPNKSVEGCICGALSSVLTGWLFHIIGVFPDLSLSVLIITALCASTLGQIGDLAESLIKRMIGIKDFSNLIPGHGGVFDRADSLLFSIPTAFICLHIAGL